MICRVAAARLTSPVISLLTPCTSCPKGSSRRCTSCSGCVAEQRAKRQKHGCGTCLLHQPDVLLDICCICQSTVVSCKVSSEVETETTKLFHGPSSTERIASFGAQKGTTGRPIKHGFNLRQVKHNQWYLSLFIVFFSSKDHPSASPSRKRLGIPAVRSFWSTQLPHLSVSQV